MKATVAPTTNGSGATSAVAARPSRKPQKLPALPAPPQPTTLMQAIIQASADPSVDPGKIGALVQLHAQLQAREWERLFNEAMADCQAALEPVRKNQTNPDTKSRYADLSRLAESALPIIHRHGFAISFGELVKEAKEGHLGVAVRISHRGGHTERSEFHVPVDLCGFKGTPNKSAIHGWGSSLTYARRYSLLCAFNIIVAGDDDGQAAGKATSSAQLKRDGAWQGFLAKINAAQSLDELAAVWHTERFAIKAWPAAWREQAIEAKETRKAELGDTLRQLQASVARMSPPPSPRQVQLTRNTLHWEEDILDDEKAALHWPAPPRLRNG